VKTTSRPADLPALKTGVKRFAVLAGRIHTVAHGTITDGVVLVEDGKVQAGGKRGEVEIPPQTPVLTAAVVTPGLIDAHAVVDCPAR